MFPKGARSLGCHCRYLKEILVYTTISHPGRPILRLLNIMSSFLRMMTLCSRLVSVFPFRDASFYGCRAKLPPAGILQVWFDLYWEVVGTKEVVSCRKISRCFLKEGPCLQPNKDPWKGRRSGGNWMCPMTSRFNRWTDFHEVLCDTTGIAIAHY